jgi:hypothetical protein
MNYDDAIEWQRREEEGDDYEPRGLSFTGEEIDEIFAGDPDGPEIVRFMMDKDMAERGVCPHCGLLKT